MRWLILALASIPAMALWATLVFVGTANGWLRTALAPPGDTDAFVAAVRERLDAEHNGNGAFRLLQNGDLAGEHYVSVDAPVTADTRFQVASVSKWLTAWGVMTLVESGAVDLDAPVQDYLRRWRLPEGPFDNDGVTVRRLLSHTAGLTDGLGYDGFAPGEALQSLEASLTRAADAMPGADGRVRAGLPPGSEWRYSGGGYTLLQLLIEEVTGQPFAAYLDDAVLTPLGMRRSTFALPGDEVADVATVYDDAGQAAPHYRYTATAAAGLYTTVADLTRFLQAQRPGPDADPAGRGVLRPDTLTLMRQPAARTRGTDVWGLGHMLYTDNDAGGFIIGHDGGNRPAINTTVRFDPASGDGIIVLVTGNRRLASELGGEWVFWRTGRLDIASYADALDRVVVTIAVGWAVIALLFGAIGWRVARRRPVAGGPADDPR
ncbi:MAG: serine hydrolase domain-containing protein [Pseudomonadales bacterium]